MSDIRTAFKSFESGADIALDGYQLAVDEGLETAVILSLFTNARANDDDVLPQGSTDRGGSWIDSYPLVDGDKFGSRLWLLQSEKITQEALNRAKQYAQEALAWLVQDGVASRVEVEPFIVRKYVLGVLGMRIGIYRPDGTVVGFRYENIWDNV